MNKKHFIALADLIRRYNKKMPNDEQFTSQQISELASFCREQNRRFNSGRWLDYIAGRCGPNGGKV